MTVKEFNELVWNYGGSGTKVIENYDERVKSAVIEAWCEIEGQLDDLTEEEADEKINCYYLNTLYYVNYNEKDLSDYYTGVGGMIDYENKSITNSLDYALSFETKEEAEKWISEHSDEWKFGDLSIC